MRPNSPRLLFNEQALPFILEAFNKKMNEDGIIIDATTGEPVLTPEGEELTKDKFGGIRKGSTIFIKNDLLTTIKLAERDF